MTKLEEKPKKNLGEHIIHFLQSELNTFYIMEDCNTRDWKKNKAAYYKNYENRHLLINPILNWLTICINLLFLSIKFEHVFHPYFTAFLCMTFAVGFVAHITFSAGYILLCKSPPESISDS